jgi:hypothetical protein
MAAAEVAGVGQDQRATVAATEVERAEKSEEEGKREK